MPVGTPGFVGNRLREAREARQMTGTILSELTGVSVASISLYENGRAAPPPQVLERLADKLNFRTSFFFRKDESASAAKSRPLFERSKSATTKTARMRGRHQRTWLRECLQYLAKAIRIPPVEMPESIDDFDWLDCSDGDLENIATLVRRSWGLGDGPISNVTLLAENHGIVVTKVSMKGKDLDAFSLWDVVDERPYIAFNTNVHSMFRLRYSVAHELGHLILHKNVTAAAAEDRNNFKLIESQADRFASAFLTPSVTFPVEVPIPTLEAFRTLKSRWKVSIKMMIHRAQDLDLLNREEARRLYISYNRRGWNKEEPLDSEYEIEEPRLVRRAFELVVENDLINRSQIVADLPFNIEDIERVANLPIGYLEEDSEYNWALRYLESGLTDPTGPYPSSCHTGCERDNEERA